MMQGSKQNENKAPPPKKFSKFGNKIKSRVNTKIVSSETDVLKNLNARFEEPPITPVSSVGFQFFNDECDLSESTASFYMKKAKSVKFDETPISKIGAQSSHKKQPVSILKNASLEKQNSSILSGSRNLLNNSSFYSNANTQRSKLSASDSVVQDQRQVLVERKKYVSLLENCMYHKKKYFDDIFPPGSSSVYSRINHSNKYGEVKWMRIGELFKNHKQYIYSYHKSLRNNLVHGNIEIPYLLTSFQSIETNIRCLERIFQDQKPNQTGIYCLRIFINGLWKYVIVDDYIPTTRVGNQQIPFFINVAGGKKDIVNIWPFLLLKAYAKAYSSYEALESGNIFDFMNELTGASVERLVISQSNLQQLTRYYNSTDYLIVLGKRVDGQMRYFPSDNGRDETFMISNFLASSPLIAVNKTKVSIEDLIDNYEQAIITKIDEQYYSVSCTIHQAKETLSIRSFKVTEEMNCHISLIQKDAKYYQGGGYKYSWVRLLVCMKESEGMRYVTGSFSNQKCIHLDSLLEPGEYYLIVIADWADKVYNMCLTYNGPLTITFDRKTEKDIPNVFEDTCTDIVQRFGSFKQLSANLCSYRCIYLPLGILVQNLNNQNSGKDIAIIKAYSQVLNEIKMNGKIKCFDKEFIKDGYTLSKRVKPKEYYTLVMMLPGSETGWKEIQYFVFDQ